MRAILAIAVLLGALMTACGEPQAVPLPGTPTPATLMPDRADPVGYTKYFVNDIITRYDSVGLDDTLAHYNRTESIDGQWYAIIIDADGKVIGHPDPLLLGEDVNGPIGTDANGYAFGPEMLAATEDGKWVSYVYRNPERGLGPGALDEMEVKNVWVVRHDGMLFASGWYVNADAFTQQLVDVAVETFKQEGLEGTIAYFASPESALAGLEITIAYYNSVETAEGQWSAFIAVEDGGVVAHSNPNLIGRDLADVLGPEPLEVSPEGNWLPSEAMRLWVRAEGGYVFGSGWHPRAP